MVCVLCALSTQLLLSHEKGEWELGAAGKEGGEAPLCTGAQHDSRCPSTDITQPDFRLCQGFAERGCWGLPGWGPGPSVDRLARRVQREAPPGPWH